jgi:exonuclease SbcD
MAAPAPAWYAGSPIQVDFGEQSERKHVLLVDAAPGVPVKVRKHALTSGWTLRTVRGTVAELAAAAESYGDAWLRVVVTEPARAGLADEVRAVLPRAVDIRVEMPESGDAEHARSRRAGHSARELFVEYLASESVDDPRVVQLFTRLYDEARAEAVH